MLLNNGELDGVRILTAKTVSAITANGLSEAVQKTRGGNGWALANVQVLPAPPAGGRAGSGEYGWDGTASTIFWIDPDKELVTILMTQSSPSNPSEIRQRFKALVQQALID
jgi:CubicO group peptidase (beta-lactamase class C family)